MTDMVEWCHHLPKDGIGRFIALKGQRPDDEVEQLPSWCSVTVSNLYMFLNWKVNGI